MKTLAKLFLVCLFMLGISSTGRAQEREYLGKLRTELVPETNFFNVHVLSPLAPAAAAKLNLSFRRAEKAFGGKLFWKGAAIPVVLVEAESGTPSLFVDVDQDGKISTTERFSFSPMRAEMAGDNYNWEMLLNLPLSAGYYRSYPLLIRLFKLNKDPNVKVGKRTLLDSAEAFAQGVVDIEGRQILFQYAFDAATLQVNPVQGSLGVDTNGDGLIDGQTFSPESAHARDETVVFRVGDKYVSTRTVDTMTGKIYARNHARTDYLRIELRLGAEMPDFAFTDFDGRTHKLSDYRGKYLLLNFWGTWCFPCRQEIPHLKAAYETYQARGFEILGLDKDDESLEKAKAFIAEQSLTWPQATAGSVKELIKARYRVEALPAHVLLDPNGLVVSLGWKGQPRLNGENLLNTLDKLLPANK